MSRCLFLFPTPEEQVKITSGGPSSQWYGVGIPYIMSYVEQYGHETDAILEYRCSFDDYFAMVIDKIITFNPEFVAMQMYSTNRVQCYQIAEYLHKNCPDIQIICGGHHASVFPDQLVKAYPYVVVVIGEGEETVKELLDHKPYHAIDGICWFDSGINQVAIQNPRQLLHVNSIPFPKHDIFFRDNPDRTMVCTMTSRGCPFHCLSGDTLIDTTDGFFHIKDLVGKQPLVLTRDPVTKDVCYARATIVMQTQTNAQLVRVWFDDFKSHIDCTPDHKFIVFKNGNQSKPTREIETEAQNLVSGQSVRAVHYDLSGPKSNYVQIVWGRGKRIPKHRLIMEGVLGRKLTLGERVHHKNKVPWDNTADNLILTNSKEHFSKHHPEISERMVDNNPSKNMTQEWHDKIVVAITGKKRSLEQRMRYRDSKLGDKNPNYIDGRRSNTKSRIKEINHVVTEIEYLPIKEDTYCMEVPGYDWFYANEVLVHNCKFCCLRKLTGNKIRYRSVENIIEELDYIKRTYPKVETIVFQDDAFTLNNQRVIDLAKKIVERNYGFKFQMASVAYPASEEMLYWMEKAGLEHIYVGLENGNQAILNKARKNLKLEDVEQLFQKLRRYPNLVVSTYLITGLPGETWDTVRDTVAFIKRLQKHSYDFVDDSTIIWLYPGTELYYEAVERGEITDDYWLGDGPCPTWTGEHTVEELQEMRQYLLNRVSFLRIFTPIGFFSQMTNAPLNVLKFIWYHPKWVKYAVGESVGYMFPRFYEWVRGYKIQRRNTG